MQPANLCTSHKLFSSAIVLCHVALAIVPVNTITYNYNHALFAISCTYNYCQGLIDSFGEEGMQLPFII
jgi:hypothetical protein